MSTSPHTSIANAHYARPATDLGQQITTLYAHINVATAQLLQLIADFDTAKLGEREGCRTTAHWLNFRCGIGLAAAREKVRVARALADLPLIEAAFHQGRLSYSKVRALSRVANPANEATLLDIARHATAAQAERILRHYRQCQPAKADCRLPGEPAPLSAELRCYWNESGDLVFTGRLPAEQGALLQAALERQMDSQPPPTEFEPEVSAARRAAALVELAETALAAVPGESGQRPSSSADRYQVHVELTNDSGHLHEGPGFQAATLERLTCDASLVVHEQTAHGEPLNVGRKTRTVPSALRRALQRRDRGCRFPGCTQHRFVDAHHVEHWAQGGETKLDNLVLLCRYHHRAVHERGFGIEVERPERGAVRFHFFSPDGEALPGVGECNQGGNVHELVRRVSAETSVDPAELTPRGGTTTPDYEHIIWWLVNFVPRE